MGFPRAGLSEADFWTQADNTMALFSIFTSCLSWQRMHVSTSFVQLMDPA